MNADQSVLGKDLPMARDDPTVTRKVYFFRIAHFDQVREGLSGACERIEGLEFNDRGRYRTDGASNYRYSLYPDTTKFPIRLRFGRIRRDGLPQIEQVGELETLALDEDAGLVDISHIVIFQDGFVAAEWNADGPKLSQMTPYFLEKGKLNDPPTFLPLLERDIVETLTKLNSVRVLELEVPPDTAELAREADKSLYDAIKAMEALGASKKIGLKLTADGGSGKLLRLARKLAEMIRERPYQREQFKSILASGRDDEARMTRYVDILESKMVTAEEFIRSSARSRSIDTDNAYRVLEQAYRSNLERLRASATSSEF
jgi:hypothetical protein|tara:strand:- start:1020 stop:1967 length:948 start_codon:yes stop_codon:yes gene_type:complete